MKTVFSPRHAGHAGNVELVAGAVVPAFEMPARAHALLDAVRQAGLAAIEPPSADQALIETVHTPEYLAFLRDGYAAWRALPDAGEEMIPNIHPTPEMLAQGGRPGPGMVARAGWHLADTACAVGEHAWTSAIAAAGCAEAAAKHVLAGARAAHRRDGAAIVRFLHWLDRQPAGSVDEIAAVTALEGFRRRVGEETQMKLRDISFDTISGSGPNGAIVHYRVTTGSNRKLEAGELYLVDSGGQYQDGTTDITRTVTIGEPEEEMRERATLVLKGLIAISTLRFPAGTRGSDIDALARHALWRAGLDYAHGTGHGVGSYLAVHEGPQRIARTGTQPLLAGMILSNEPGCYKAGRYGIRLENLIVVRAPEPVEGGDIAMHGFETLTLAPFDRRLIRADLLDAAEREWLDAYHARVLEEIGPMVDGEVLAWLEAATAPL